MNAIERADKANAILTSPLFVEAFETVRQRLLEGLETLPLSDTAAIQSAEDFRRCLKLLKSVRMNLETAVNSGKLDAFRLHELDEKRKNPLRGIFR